MTGPQPHLILASGSRYRRALLARLGLDFEQVAPEVDETALPDEDAAALSLRLAETKALAVAQQVDDGWVIGSDQTAALGARILGKPGTASAAREQLAACSGTTVVFHTGLCVLSAEHGRRFTAIDQTIVEFRALTAAEIDRYVEREPALDSAGSFRVEGLGISLFRAVRSDDPGSLIGLPLIRLCEFLRSAGFALP